MPTSLHSIGHLCLDIADGGSKDPDIKPCQVYRAKPLEKVEGSEIVMSVDKIMYVSLFLPL